MAKVGDVAMVWLRVVVAFVCGTGSAVVGDVVDEVDEVMWWVGQLGT